MDTSAIIRLQYFNLQFDPAITHHRAHYGGNLTDFFPFRA